MQGLELQNTEKELIPTFFADVIVPVPIPNLYTYRIPQNLEQNIQIGSRVVVQFGRRKVLTAVIANIHQKPPEHYKAKYILELLDEEPLITPQQIELFKWMAEYYMCNIGEVMNVALPSGLKISSQSKIQIHPHTLVDFESLSKDEQNLLQVLETQDSLTYDEAVELIEGKNIYQVIKKLVAKKAVILFEEIKEKYQPKFQKRIRLQRKYVDEENLNYLVEKLQENKIQVKQLDILLFYLSKVPIQQDWTSNENGLAKYALKEQNFSDSSLRTLIKNEIFEEFEVIVSRFENIPPDPDVQVELSEAQEIAFQEILQSFKEKNITLLQGVTGSGKTEIYIKLIEQVLASGSQVLYLLPEIALTTQIVARLQRFFGSQMGVYHSKFSDNERVEVWQGILSGKYAFVVGVRSAIFLPFDNLGLIIVDEEHESSYKQYDPAPRYHARDMATVIAQQQQAKVLLGSATPSIESYFQAQENRYGLVNLTERFGNAKLPTIELIDIKEESKQKRMRSHFSSTLLKAMENAKQKEEQIILFQNRRGYAPYISCKDCAWVPRCQHCDVSLTFHMHSKQLVCHYCGYQQEAPSKCSACGSPRLETVGHGTEKLEDELKIIFPEIKVQRMDWDTTRQKNSYQKIIQDFEARNIDALVGTQMLSKGLDFDRVSIVGVFDVDRMMNFPDFRSEEKAFQIITQVSGRAGRKDKAGKVLIQTRQPNHSVFKLIIENHYQGLYQKEIEERRKYFYPPFARLIRLTVKHLERNISQQSANYLAQILRKELGASRILGPEAPIVNKIRNYYLHTILIKIERGQFNLQQVKIFVREEIEKLKQKKQLSKLQVVVDVDPL